MAETLKEHLDDFIADTLARCTRCGRCFEACPMTRYGDGLPVANADNGAYVVGGVLDWLRQTPGNAASTQWLKVCTQSARCIDACPEDINAMKMVRVAQISALGALGAPAALTSREEKDFFRRINAYSATQMSAEEMEKWQR